jgi:hypothetical protein
MASDDAGLCSPGFFNEQRRFFNETGNQECLKSERKK